PRISNVKIIPLLKYLEGYTYIYIGNYEESIKSFDYFLNSKNEFSDIETLIQDNYLKLTLCNLKLNRYDAAENNFELYGKNKVVDRFADEALYYKSNIELGPDEKMQIDDQISGDTSRLINAMFYASLYKELHKNASLKNEAFNADCDYILGTAMNKLGRPEVAVKLFNRFLSNSGYNDKTDKTLYLLAKYYGETDKNLALSYYRQLVNGFLKSPYWTESFYFLVQYYFNEKKYSEIIKYAEVLKMKMLDEKTVKSYRFEFDDLLYYFALSYEMNVYYKEAVELYELYKTKFKTGLHIEDIELRLKKIKFK
ncbi:hypothetical protein KA977_01495, partial [Candidatus Dependentiae bacterium]|nr:hypothetical protein [Candidatus Dependentiae bacterium]